MRRFALTSSILCLFLVHSSSCIRLKTRENREQKTKARHAPITCCDHQNCLRTCSTTRSHPLCSRSVRKSEVPTFEKGEVILTSSEARNECANSSTPTVSYSVDSGGVLLSGEGTCTTDKCNRCRFPFEKCPFPGTQEPRELKCACNRKFIEQSHLSYKYEWGNLDMAPFCVRNVCSFQDIQRKFPFLESMQDLFVCVTEVTHSRDGRNIRYGCDLADTKRPHAFTKSREVFMNAEKTNWRVECRDFQLCNHALLYQNSLSSWNADPEKLQSCILSPNKRPMSEDLCHMTYPWSEKSTGFPRGPSQLVLLAAFAVFSISFSCLSQL